MTEFRNAVIITHEVYHRGVESGMGMSVLTSSAMQRMTDYYAARGQHADKEIDRGLTEQDIALEAAKTAGGVQPMLDYYGRQGRHAGRNEEIPMVPGETSGECWDGSGVVDVGKVGEEILASGSNLIRTVVSVPREWAAPLRLATKAQWQQLIRSTWPKFVDAMDVMDHGGMRWCAFFHTDNSTNLHVHVLTWDSTGRFSGREEIPHRTIERSKEVVRRQAFAAVSLERSALKGYAREAATARAKSLLGYRLPAGTEERLAQMAKNSKAPAFDLGEPSCIDRATLRRLAERAAMGMPESGTGRAGYASSSPETRAAANLARAELMRDPIIERCAKIWSGQVEIGADILGKQGADRTKYVRSQEADLERRVANIFLKKAAALNTPWRRNPDLAAERAAVIEICAKAMPEAPAKRGAAQIGEAEEPSAKTMLWGGYAAIESDAGKAAVGRYVENVVAYASSGKRLNDNQRLRLAERVRHDLAAVLQAHARAKSYAAAVKIEARKGSAAMSSAVVDASMRHTRAGNGQTMLGPNATAQVRRAIDETKREIKRGGDPFIPAAKAAAVVMRTPEARASARRVARFAAQTERPDEAIVAARIASRNAVASKVVEIAARELEWDNRKSASYSRSAAIDAVVSAAMSHSGGDDHPASSLMTRIAGRKHRRSSRPADRDMSAGIS